MRGAVAAGHPLTAEAGAQVLAEGGNAVDACIAAAFVSWVTESPLTGAGAGGFMLIHRGSDATTRVLDHFVTVPGLGLPRGEASPMDEVPVDFSPESRQMYRIGPSSCAVPGALAGLKEAHRRFGTLPWSVLLEPAIEHARNGVELNQPQGFLHEILDVILRHTDEGRAMYSSDGDRLVAGDLLVMADLARTLEQLAERGRRRLLPRRAGPRDLRARPRRRRRDHAGGPGRLPGDPAPAGEACSSSATSSSRTRRRRPAAS